ncbi:MAG: TonB-dependent receptor [Steroidobacteraceae bacterium]
MKTMAARDSVSKLVCAIVGAALAAPAMAAPAPGADDSSLEEVIVTARKRDESFRDVPMTVNVFTEQAIAAAGIAKPGDFIARVPNMTLVETQNAGNAFVVVRGISQARNSEPSVAVLVDGVLETNPAEFNKELFDIRQIEVLKGPQGALYGRNAIGGAILIRTKDPSDEITGVLRTGLGNGGSVRAQAALSGPLGSSDTLKFRASLSYVDTDGFLDNVYLKQKADPSQEISGRARLLWKPTTDFSADLRFAFSNLETRALYFVIPRDVESNPFSSFSTPPNANDVTSPIQLDNPGVNTRDLYTTSLKMDFETGLGTLTSVSAYDVTKEVLTGDAYDFRPAATSVFKALLGTDLNQSQYLDLKSWSQEVRLTGPSGGIVSWIGGAYYVHTSRFISTGNMVDTGAGVFPVYRTPRLTGNNPSATFLADSQNNNAWAVFANATVDLSKNTQFDAALRYDEDNRRNTTLTPAAFLPDPSAHNGEVREHTWSKLQPKATLRYKPSDNVTLYTSWSRGFRSGGFNQTGVGAVANAGNIAGVNDLFNAEVADTFELGVKGRSEGGRMDAGLSLYSTKSRNGYFFVFLAANSTQNLGNLDSKLNGFELEVNARPVPSLELHLAYGLTDSKITGMEDPSVIGNEAPLVSRDTLNLGATLTRPVRDGLDVTLRADFQRIGRTWWEPYNTTSRDPVSLLDARAGLRAENWAVTAWGRNLTDKKYNAEFSPGGFLFRALPRRYGLDLEYRF